MSGNTRLRISVIGCFFLLAAGAGGPAAWGQSLPDDPEGTMIGYDCSDGLEDTVAVLQTHLTEGTTRLVFEPRGGYLRSLLQALSIPVSSQTLVFSKTSSQRDYTSPQTPRAIYFGDTVSVAWVPDGPEIDLISVDKRRGPIFYTMEQTPNRARFRRRADCLQCHLGPKTQAVPGWIVRSFYTASNGSPLATVDGFASGHHSAINKRWGGWFVTGSFDKIPDPLPPPAPANRLDSPPAVCTSSTWDEHRTFALPHLGNLYATDPALPQRLDGHLPISQGIAGYLSPHSDLTALLVLEHQVRMQNLITRANYETRYAVAAGLTNAMSRHRMVQAGEALLEYLLFSNEAPFPGAVRDTGPFWCEFEATGPRTSDGRSLRQFDLCRRLFRYPCSYLIYSPAFDALPAPMLHYLYERLKQILQGIDQTDTYANFSTLDRRQVLEILCETKPEFAGAVTR